MYVIYLFSIDEVGAADVVLWPEYHVVVDGGQWYARNVTKHDGLH